MFKNFQSSGQFISKMTCAFKDWTIIVIHFSGHKALLFHPGQYFDLLSARLLPIIIVTVRVSSCHVNLIYLSVLPLSVTESFHQYGFGFYKVSKFIILYTRKMRNISDDLIYLLSIFIYCVCWNQIKIFVLLLVIELTLKKFIILK